MFDGFGNPSYFGSSYGVDSHTVECTRMDRDGDSLRVTKEECLDQLGGDEWEEIEDAVVEDSSGWSQPFETLYHNFWNPLGHCYKCTQSWTDPTPTQETVVEKEEEEEEDAVADAIGPDPQTSPNTSPANGGSATKPAANGSSPRQQGLPSVPLYKQPWFWTSIGVGVAVLGTGYFLSRPVKR